jgi:hypothetical protein
MILRFSFNKGLWAQDGTVIGIRIFFGIGTILAKNNSLY